MKKLISILVPCLVVGIFAQASDEFPVVLKRDQQGNIFSATVEMAGPNDTKILLIGLVHYGPVRFYQDIQQKVSAWTNQEARSTAVMHEFLTCHGEVLDSTNLQATPEDLKALRDANLDYSPDTFINRSEMEIAPLLKAFNFKKTPCVLDVDGKTMRPPYYVSRNQSWCEQAESHGAACQWKALGFSESKLLKNVEADLKIDELPAGMQFTGVTMFREFEISEHDDLLRYLYWPSSWVILDYRNYNLLKETTDQISKGTKRLVLPWGAMHLPGLIESLKQMGYQKTSVTDILYTTPDEAKKWESLQSVGESAGDQYGF